MLLIPRVFSPHCLPDTLLYSTLMVVTAALGTVFLWGERGVKNNNFYPKEEISPWTSVLAMVQDMLPGLLHTKVPPTNCCHAAPTDLPHCQPPHHTWSMWALSQQALQAQI